MAMTLVSTVTVPAGNLGSIEWNNIPQTGKDLMVLFSLRSTRTGGPESITNWYLNASSSGYTYRRLRGTGSAVDSLSGSEQWPAAANSNSVTTNTFGNGSLYISNYTNSTAKSGSIDSVSENNSTNAIQTILATSWSGTSAVTSLVLTDLLGGDWMQNSTASLYIIS